MGSTCRTCTNCSYSDCVKYEAPLGIISTNINNEDWADAVTKLNIAGIKMLHATDPELINEAVDEYGTRAIHIAVKHKHYNLLQYLLENGADTNLKGGKDANTALHEAVKLRDSISTKWLFAFNASHQLINRRRKRAFEICHRHFKREYVKAKLCRNNYENGKGKNNRNDIFDEGLLRRTPSPIITVSGIPIDKTEILQKFFQDTNDERIYYKMKKEEIEKRIIPITEFGNNIGIDIDEIAITFQKIPTKQRLWNVWINEHISTINTQNDVYKIIFGLTWLSLKKKHGINATKPSSIYIKQITRILCNQYLHKTNKGKPTLTTYDFVENFHSYLYQLHDQMLYKETKK